MWYNIIGDNMATREELNKDKHKKIASEKEKEEKRKKIVFTFKLIVFSIIFITALFFYITYISNLHIIVRENRIVSKKIPNSFNGTKIIQFSDIHFGTTITKNELSNLVKIINSRKPDIVVFTGDLINKDYELSSKELEEIISALNKINPPLGKYAIRGEEDDESFITIFNQCNFTILNNDYELIYKDDTTPILLVGVDNKPDINKAFKYYKDSNYNSNIFTTTILHKPDYVEEINSLSYKSDIYLAGHSHNGQIRIPFLGTPLRKKGSQKYYNEYYNLKNSKLYITSGIGTNGSGIRLFTHPSINLFRLSNK